MKTHLYGILVTAALFAVGLAVAAAGMAADPVGLLRLDADTLPFVGMAGLLINRENVSEIFRNIRTTFQQVFEATPTRWQSIATQIDTNQLVEKIDWLDAFPNWRKWVGDKVVNALAAHSYALELEEWETTIAVKRRDIEADRLGIYRMKATSAGELAAYFPDERVAEALNGAFTNPCWDGKPYFATDHPTKKKDGSATTFSNKITVPLSVSTQAAAIAGYGAAKTQLGQMRNEQGRPIRVRNRRLVVPSALEDIANALMNNERLEDGKPNPYRGTATVEVWEELESDTAWFLMGEAGGLKPIIYLVRKHPTTGQVTDLNDSQVFKSGEFLFGAEADAVAGYTFPQLAVGSTG